MSTVSIRSHSPTAPAANPVPGRADRGCPGPGLQITALPENRPPAVIRQFSSTPPPPNQPALVPLHLSDEPPDESVDERVTRFATGLARAILEVLQGRRAATQLTRWLSEVAQAELLHRVRQRRRNRAWSLRSVRVQQPHRHGAEVTFRIGHDGRDAALAMRLDQLGDRWVCSVLDFGPGPFLP